MADFQAAIGKVLKTLEETMLAIDSEFNVPEYTYPLSFKYAAFLIVLGVIFNIIVAPIFLFSLSKALSENSLKKNKLNKDDVNYSTLRSVNTAICKASDAWKYFWPPTYAVSGNEYGFIWIVGISILITVLSIVLMNHVKPDVKLFGILMFVVGLIMAVLNSSIYNGAACSAVKANNQYNDFNSFCADNTIQPHTIKPQQFINTSGFLAALTVPSNTFQMEKQVEAAFQALQAPAAATTSPGNVDTIEVDTLAKALFTTNLYAHFCKIDSFSNIASDDDRASALSLFNSSSYLTYAVGGSEAPNFTDYLYSNNTTIHDYCGTISIGKKGKACEACTVFVNANNTNILDAAQAKATTWTNELNGKMQLFDPKSNFQKIFNMAIGITFLQTLPITVPAYIYYKRSKATTLAN